MNVFESLFGNNTAVKASGAGMGHPGMMAPPLPLASNMAAQQSYATGVTLKPEDKWSLFVEKTEDGYVFDIVRSGVQNKKKFIAKDIDELKDKIVSAIVLSKIKD